MAGNFRDIDSESVNRGIMDDGAAKAFEEFGHNADICNIRNVRERISARGKERGGHQL
jgi:hypothetical protein